MPALHLPLPELDETALEWLLRDLWEIEGVLQVLPNYQHRTLTVIFEPPATEEDIRNLIQDALLAARADDDPPA